MLITIGCIAVGTIAGYVSNDAGLMMFSRLIEGLGSGLIFVAAPAAIIPEVMGNPQLSGLGMAVTAAMQNLGFIIGLLYFGAIVERGGWQVTGYALIPMLLLAIVAARLVKIR